MKKLRLPKGFWVAVLMSALIGVVFYYYFFFYIAGNERQFIDSKFRALSRTAENIKEGKKNSLEKFHLSLNNLTAKILKSPDNAGTAYEKWKEFQTDENAEGRDVGYLKTISFQRQHLRMDDSVHIRIPIDADELDYLSFILNKDDSQSPIIQFSQSISIPAFLRLQDIDLENKFDEFVIVKILKNPAGNSGLKKIILEQGDELKTTSANTEKTTASKKTTDTEIQHEASTAAVIAYQTLTNELRLNILDSLSEKEPGFYSGKIKDVKIQGGDYKLFTHRFEFEVGEDWLLCGLSSKKTFTHETHSVELFVGLFAAFLILSILFSMPILKLAIMSSVERLQIINVWFTGFSIVVGSAVIVLLMLFGSQDLGGQKKLDDRLHILGKRIEKSFEQELDSIVRQLNWFERNQGYLFTKSLSVDTNRFSGKLMNLERHRGIDRHKPQSSWVDPDLSFLSGRKLTYPYFNQCIWIDKHGDQSLLISTAKVDKYETPIRLDDRKYWQKVYYTPENLWALRTKIHKDENRFALQSIRSWRSGLNEAGVSIPITDTCGTGKRDPKVLAISTRFGTVMEPLLPPGYGFCIIDDTGAVWFHSDTKLNNRMQLFEEVPDSSKILLRSAALGRDSVALTFKYGNTDVRGYTLPINGLPLSLVVFYDMDYYHRPLSLTAGHASIMVTIMFGIIGIHLLLLFIFTYKPSRLHIRRFFLNWLRPVKNDQAIKNIKGIEHVASALKYQRSVFFLAIVLIFMMLLCWSTHARWLGICFFMLPLYILTFHFVLYRREFILMERSKDHRQGWTLLLHKFVLASAALVLIINGTSWQYIPENPDRFFIFLVQVFWLIAAWLCYNFPENLKEWNFLSFPKSYRYSFVLWLVLVSFLAPVYFYVNAFHTENTIWKRGVLLQAARSNFQRLEKLNARKIFEVFNREKQIKEIKRIGNYLTTTGEIAISSIGTKPSENLPFDELLFKADPLLGGVMNETRQAIFPATADSLWYWNSCDSGDSIILQYDNHSGSTLRLSTALPDLSPWEGNYWKFMGIFSIVVLLSLTRLIRFSVKHIFGIGLIDSVKVSGVQNKLDGFEKIFLISLPYSERDEAVNKIINDACHIDLRERKQYTIEFEKVIVLEYFEHGINSHTANEEKLKLLNYVCRHAKNKVIILSAVQPSVIFDFYDSQLDEIDIEKDRVEWREYKQAYRYWKNILVDFAVFYRSLSKSDVIEAPCHTAWFINSELTHGCYLLKLKQEIQIEGDYIKGKTLDTEYNYREKEELVLQVQERAQNYYHTLWNSFSSTEKFLLYDLAKDRFVNFRNLEVIRTLMQKGVLITNDSLRIMNRSFNNFILSVVKEDEEMKMEQELRSKGTWHTVQIALIMVLLGLAAFIAFAQQGILSNVNAWVTAVTGIVALITRFSGVFGSKSKS